MVNHHSGGEPVRRPAGGTPQHPTYPPQHQPYPPQHQQPYPPQRQPYPPQHQQPHPPQHQPYPPQQPYPPRPGYPPGQQYPPQPTHPPHPTDPAQPVHPPRSTDDDPNGPNGPGGRHSREGGGGGDSTEPSGHGGGDEGSGGEGGEEGGGDEGGDPPFEPTTPSGQLSDGSEITQLLEPPPLDESDVKDLVNSAGFEVAAVDWVFQKIAGTSLVDVVIKPITGDFSKMRQDAAAWNTIADTMKQFSATMAGNAGIVTSTDWKGPSALAHKAYVDIGWKAGLLIEGEVAKLIAKGFDTVADGSEKLAEKALELLKKLIDKLIIIAAKACVPVVGWAAEATTIIDAIDIANKIFEIIQLIEDIVSKVGDMWNSLKDIGSQLSKIKDIQSLGDVKDIVTGVKGDVGDIKDSAGGIVDDAGEIKDKGKEIKESAGGHSEEEHQPASGHQATGAGEHPASGHTPAHSSSGSGPVHGGAVRSGQSSTHRGEFR
jgi:hypothetical protein